MSPAIATPAQEMKSALVSPERSGTASQKQEEPSALTTGSVVKADSVPEPETEKKDEESGSRSSTGSLRLMPQTLGPQRRSSASSKETPTPLSTPATATPTSTTPTTTTSNDTTPAAAALDAAAATSTDDSSTAIDEATVSDQQMPTPTITGKTDLAARIYDRDFLLSFRYYFTTKPEGLPDVSAIIGSDAARALTERNDKRQGNKQQGTSGWRQAGAPRQNRQRVDGRGGRGGGRGGRRGKQDDPMDIVVAPLEKTDSRYVVKRDAEGEERVMRDLNSILNKLTPEKFDTLVQQVVDLRIDNVELLKQVVDLVFEKALSEPAFSAVYAEFCEKLGGKLPQFKEGEKSQTFRRLILNQCQGEFEKTDSKSEKPADMSDLDWEEQNSAQKRRMLGTIRFIGELFVRGVLSGTIMMSCTQILLGDTNNPVEEDTEALCNLLKTVGATLEKKQKDFVAEVIYKLTELTKSKKLSSRLRFMCQDIIDLKGNRWRDRLGAEKAKKISEIRKEDSDDKKKKERDDRRADDNRRGGNKPQPVRTQAPKKDRYARASEIAPPTPTKGTRNGEEWETVSKPAKGGWRTQDARKGKAAPSPSRAASKSSSSANGRVDQPVHKKNPKNPSKKEERKPKAALASGFGAFAMLGDEDDEEEEDVSDDDEVEEEEEEDDYESVDEDDDGGLSRDQALSKIKSLLKEFAASEDIPEALLCISELKTTKYHSDIVDQALAIILETKDRERELMIKLFDKLAADRILKPRHFTAGPSPFTC